MTLYDLFVKGWLMSQFKNVIKELQEISKQVMVLAENESWEILDEILEMIRLFGEKINSNGITSQEDIKKMHEIKSKNKDIYIHVLFDNLQLLLKEYEHLAVSEQKKSVVYPFEYSNNMMALLKDEVGDYCFIHETHEDYELMLKEIDAETEAIILIGYGSGLLHSKLSNNYHTLTVDPFSLHENIQNELVLSLIHQDDKYLLQQKLQSFIGLKTEVIPHPFYPHSYKLVELLKRIRHLLEEVQIDLNTRALYTEKWYKETFMNAAFINKQTDRVINIDQLKGSHTGSNALMIAGGPSLEEAIPYLKKAQDSYYIIAIGQTVKALLDNQIYPDYVISIDVSEANAYFFKDIELNVPLVYSLQVNHHIPKSSRGLLIPYADMPIAQELLSYSKEIFSTYPTVALSAVAFANYLGFNEIGLIGQDLALRKGEYYSPSVKQASSNDGLYHKKMYDVTLNNGEKGKTTPILFNFLTGYASLIEQYPELVSKLLNYAEHGALIDQVKYQPLTALKTTKVLKEKLQIEKNCSAINIPVEKVQSKFAEVINQLESLKKRLRRSINQKAITVDEFEKILNGWDDLIETSSFRTHILPLQLVNFLIIQNKISSHNRFQKYSSVRIQILVHMFETIEKLIEQLKSIHALKIEV